MKITWLGHSSLKLETDSQTIYIDPYAGKEEDYKPGNLILISQNSFDHFNRTYTKKATGEITHTLSTKETASELFPCGELRPGEKKIFEDIEIIGVESFNHRPELKGETKTSMIGFLIKTKNKKIYFMGDSDFFRELTNLKPDILFISIGGTYTMTPKDAAKATQLISPKLTIPIHWGSIEGTKDNAELFKELAEQEGFIVEIPEPGKTINI